MRKYIKNIIFTKTPLKNNFKYEDKFQIYPLNIERAPNIDVTDHFPIIIEYWYETDDAIKISVFDDLEIDNIVSLTTVQTNKLIEITSLLSSITNFQFFFYRWPETFWSIPLTNDAKEHIKEISSIWSASLYYYPEIDKDLKIEGFTETDFTAVTLVPHKKYYYDNPIESKEKTIDFPDTIHFILEKYFALIDVEVSIASSCIYQICNGLELFSKMKSLSFFSFVSSIETLVNYEFRNELIEFDCPDCKSLKESSRVCKRCGAPIWGVSAKYREFLFKYVANTPDAKKMYNKIYNIRSKITHTEYLMSGDRFLSWDFNDKTEEINLTHLRVMQLSRRSFVNWLIFKDD